MLGSGLENSFSGVGLPLYMYIGVISHKLCTSIFNAPKAFSFPFHIMIGRLSQG